MSRRTAAISLAFVFTAAAAEADDTPLPPGFDRIETIVVVYGNGFEFE